jgi:hypothetical protein
LDWRTLHFRAWSDGGSTPSGHGDLQCRDLRERAYARCPSLAALCVAAARRRDHRHRLERKGASRFSHVKMQSDAAQDSVAQRTERADSLAIPRRIAS